MNTITVSLSLEAATKLERLSRVTKQSPSTLVAEALDAFLETQAWQIDRSPDDPELASAEGPPKDLKITAEELKVEENGQ